jgi:uncharacterized integral membrane protein (TIGR00698 family)
MLKREELSGLLLTIAIAAVAFGLTYFFALGTLEINALIIGFVLANAFKLNATLTPGIKFSEKKILGWAIALMGLQLSFAKLDLSWWLAPVIILAMLIAIGIGYRIATRFGVFASCGYMMGVGTAICGASAIAAVSPFLKTEAHETGVAIGVVNLLGTAGMVILPAAALALGFTNDEAGVLIGGSLQAVGQVVGAGYAMNEATGEIATLVKLGRVLMLGPVVLFTALIMHTKTQGVDRKKVLPAFILVFILLLIIANIFTIPEPVLAGVKTADKALLAIAMAGIGLQIKLRDLLKQGPKALLLGSLIFAVQISLMLAFVYGQRFFT